MAGTSTYEFGDVAVLSVTFTVAGAPTDPTAVTAEVLTPDGTRTSYSTPQIVHDGTGAYHLDLDCDQAGEWVYEFVGTGAAADVETGVFYVKPDPTQTSLNGRDLCSLHDVFRLVPGFDPQDPDNGDIVDTIGGLISAESRAVHRETGREIRPIANLNTRTFDVTAAICQRRQFPIGDAAAIATVELFDFDGTTSLGVLDPNLYIALPRIRDSDAPIRRLSFPYRPGIVMPRLAPGRSFQITATWGFPSVPVDLRQAAAKRVLLRYVADNANAGTQLADALDDTFSIGALLRSAKETVDGYSRGSFA
jgi:hypothetical protein